MANGIGGGSPYTLPMREWCRRDLLEIGYVKISKTPIKKIWSIFIGGLLLQWSLSVSLAQTKPDTPPAEVSVEPQSTTATFGDWVLRCSRADVGGQAQRICEVAQTIVLQGQQAPVAELAIGRIKKTDPLRVTVLLPVNVAFPSAPQLKLDGQPSLELTWNRCLPNGCFANATPKEELIRGWRGAKTTGRIETKDALGRNVVVTVSFRGLTQALDALVKE